MSRTAAFLIATTIAVFLSGCAHQLTLMAENGGSTGSGTATGTNRSGEVTIALKGKTYKGQWVQVQQGGFGYTSGFAGNTTFGATSVMAGGSSGNALMKAADGSGLRCDFNWSALSSAGVGKCRDDAGTIYDLQIR